MVHLSRLLAPRQGMSALAWVRYSRSCEMGEAEGEDGTGDSPSA